MQHRILEKNTQTLSGVCQTCGPVRLYHRKDRNSYLCAVGKSQNRGGRNRDRSGEPSNAGHGLTKGEAAAYKAGKVCWICGSADRLVIDHCHETGVIRGVLCSSHNLALGLFRDDALHLERAIHYLSKRA